MKIKKRRFLSALREGTCEGQAFRAKTEEQIVRLAFVPKKL